MNQNKIRMSVANLFLTAHIEDLKWSHIRLYDTNPGQVEKMFRKLIYGENQREYEGPTEGHN